jgi:predicted MFS family arabinose efflux permease
LTEVSQDVAVEKENRWMLFRNPRFAWLFTAQTLSVMGSQLGGFAITVVAVVLLHATEGEMGILNAAGTAAFLVVGLLAGAWVDRWVKRRVMIIADLVRMVLIGLIPALYLSDMLEVWHLIVIGAAVGVATVFFDVAYQSVIPILFKNEHIAPANSALETSAQISHISGPPLAGWLVTIFKAPAVLIFDAISFGVSALTLSFIKDDEKPKPREDRRPLREEIAEGIKFVWNEPIIRAVSFCTSSTNLFNTIGTTLMAIYVLRELEISLPVFGIIMTVAGIGGLAGAAMSAKLADWIGEGQLIAVSAFGSAAAFMMVPLTALADRFWAPFILAAIEFAISFFVLTYNITQVSARQRICPKPLLGRMNASIRFFVWGVMPIGALLSGVLGTAFGSLTTIIIGGVGMVFASLFVILHPLARMRKLPTAPENQEVDAA